MSIALVANPNYYNQAACGKVSIEKLAETIFPNFLERNVFLNNIELFQKACDVTWYWYGEGVNGKTTLMHALTHKYGYTRLPGDGEAEVYTYNGNTIKISNQKPNNAASEFVTYFSQTFS
uniref:Uncharacterized protein n=1 Tax=Marseillevirus LCMAC202 TaxID=2506606 RepID=A0A481Z031_9VIRU|nr:MAG: hypothetical protein LCMAC202_04280 [Marseillevirus LCMAC202]